MIGKGMQWPTYGYLEIQIPQSTRRIYGECNSSENPNRQKLQSIVRK